MIRHLLLAALTLAAPLAHAIEITPRVTEAGHEVWVVEDSAIPLVALQFHFKGGAQLDQAGKRGETNLMVALLDEGAGARDARDFARAKEELAAEFHFRASDDSISVSARFLSEEMTPAMALLTDALNRPRFDADALERVRRQVIAGLRSSAEDVDDKADRAFWAGAFGDDPYGTDLSGTEESVAVLTRDDLSAAHQRALSSGAVHIAVAGDVDWEVLAPLIDAALAPLPEATPALPAPVEPNFNGSITVVPHDSPQSVIRFGQPGLMRDDPDFLTAFVLDRIIGGGFDGRLMQSLRTDRGLTYGVWTALVPRDRAASYIGGLSVPNDRADEAVEVLRDIWSDLAVSGVTEAELERAKTYLTGAYPLRFDGNGQISMILAAMQSQGLTATYPEIRNDLVDAITLDDVNTLAAKLLKPEALSITIAGQPEGVVASDND